jgi:predicted nuclease with TOPRIM domain
MNHIPHLNPTKLEESRQQTVEELLKTIQELEKENALQHGLLKEMATEIQLLRKRLAEQEKDQGRQNSAGYQDASSWISKIAFTLQQENRPLRSSQLIRLLEKREPSLAQHYNKVQYFSAFLSNAVNYGRVIQHKVKGVRGFYYLLPDWLDAQGTVKPDYSKAML